MKTETWDKKLINDVGLKMPKKERDEYDQDALNKGIEVELEHTDNEKLAAIITAHHLDEFETYYEALDEMESKLRGEGEGEEGEGGEEGEIDEEGDIPQKIADSLQYGSIYS
jgi:hypothetical protein